MTFHLLYPRMSCTEPPRWLRVRQDLSKRLDKNLTARASTFSSDYWKRQTHESSQHSWHSCWGTARFSHPPVHRPRILRSQKGSWVATQTLYKLGQNLITYIKSSSLWFWNKPIWISRKCNSQTALTYVKYKSIFFLLPEGLQNAGFHQTGISLSSNCCSSNWDSR